ncbi:MAG: NAD(P)/FAD-dependent oxidoreductase [Acidobacteria bacterium]|nr:MAG: NAD(P)/FAD-dependent oxidoreductase [Acidobacteriota bacterium]REJ98851.1 MAG: NAD(P)/FAD-dependent oxidoreductase [Acidobacteriota bacterium]REK16429.1 MAG: NAD(P)/FAD-dependent oxidoreductase [Acidobacteriota bacterium]REK44110.1 MAG: NAD(P)/FAD-dependent oxidoreductase [Acidobacteriota bacterium]
MRMDRLGNQDFDVLIVGAGLAGLCCARRLASGGAFVLLVDAKKDLTESVHTTGIFVRKTFEDFDLPAGSLGRAISKVRLYSPSLKTVDLDSEQPEYRIGDMKLIYRSLLEECADLGVTFLSGTRFSASIPDKQVAGGSIVRLVKGRKRTDVRTKLLIGADGTDSRVARDLELDRNQEWIVGFEEVLTGIEGPREPMLHCFLDSELAPGYIGWIADDGNECHVGVGGYTDRFEPKTALSQFREHVVSGLFDLSNSRLVESRGGRIPVGGILKKIACERGLLIGDAAGAVSPLTAGGLDPCLRLSVYAAEIALARLSSDDPSRLRSYSGKMFRTKFIPRMMLRALFRSVKFQVQFEFLFWAITTWPGRWTAEKIFYRRASFPDVNADHPLRRPYVEGLDGHWK